MLDRIRRAEKLSALQRLGTAPEGWLSFVGDEILVEGEEASEAKLRI